MSQVLLTVSSDDEPTSILSMSIFLYCFFISLLAISIALTVAICNRKQSA